MKNILLFLFFGLTPLFLFGQIPKAFNYQAVVRDADGNPIIDEPVKFTVELLQSGTLVYSEIQSGNTGELGHVNFQVGKPDTVLFGDFSIIDWSLGEYKIQVTLNGEPDPIGVTEIVAVPFALYAENAGGDGDWEVEGDTLLGSSGRSIRVDGSLDVKNNYYWHTGQNFLLHADSSGEFSFDFPDADGQKRLSVWDPDHGHILSVRNNDRVGIGTVNPKQELHIFQSNGSNADLRLQSAGADYMDVFSGDEKGGVWIKDERYMVLGTNNKERIRIASDGKIGIGINDPVQALHVRVNNGYAQMRLERTGSKAGHSTIGGSSDGFIVGHFDNDPNPGYHIDFKVSHQGQAEVKTLKITGADIIEKANSKEPIQPGEVITIDPSNPNQVERSTKSYDRTVLGVVSGAGGVQHGMELSQEGLLDGNVSFAIAGRVYVKVVGKVKPGDLLTSSIVPGHAMVAKNRRKARGAIIGKALTTVNEEGMVLILVNLQ